VILNMRKSSIFIQTQALLVCASFVLPGQTPAPEDASLAPRTVRIGGSRGQPAFTLRVLVQGAQGVIEVRKASALVQTLSCPLLRDVFNPSKELLQGLGGPFISMVSTADLNFDGYQDIRAVREHGAKWGIFCVWLYNPNQQLFVKDRVAEEMELLSNLEVDPKTRIIRSCDIGPTDPMCDEYRIESAHDGRPYSDRLIPVQSCLLKTGQGPSDRMAVLTEYQNGRPVIHRSPMAPDIEATCDHLCNCVRKAVVPGKAGAPVVKGQGR